MQERKIGDKVLCEWDEGRLTEHEITGIKKGVSQTGIMYQVSPKLRLTNECDWIDSGWFFDVATPD